jgi:hypothetical protein
VIPSAVSAAPVSAAPSPSTSTLAAPPTTATTEITRPSGEPCQPQASGSYEPIGAVPPEGKPTKFSTYWITGWLNSTDTAPAASASSTL